MRIATFTIEPHISGQGFSLEAPKRFNLREVKDRIRELPRRSQRRKAQSEYDILVFLARACWKLGGRLERNTLKMLQTESNWKYFQVDSPLKLQSGEWK